ncbi:MAG: flagellar biosynthetic protein FliQ [Acidobacteriaceae bacterium]|nr:flagellar biosynthetic protein FliQ [Acidobacteriaceae bacterium]MBV9037242.1 flagellar biosynthetic protein FliQ [Acidobacteriaceae bacterium]MBV9676248.1 flagellar biosynthetic protein FliQ [Acidobacteriaceae bacterium]
MNPQFVIHIIAEALTAAFWICAPLLLITFALSIVVNLIQIATSMQDSVFSTVPRLAVCLVGFIFLMPWMLHRAAAYATSIFGDLARYAR